MGHVPRHYGEAYYTVHPFGSATTCPACGRGSARNSEVSGVFVCAACKGKFFAEEAAATIIAGKGIHLEEIVRSHSKGSKLTTQEKFEN